MVKKSAMLRAAAGVPHGPFNPESIVGLAGWWDFSDASVLFSDTGLTTPASADGNIKGVADKAVANHDLTGAGTNVTYKTAIQNSLSVGRFANTSSGQLQATVNVPNGFTVFAVAKFSSVAQSRRQLFGGGGNALGADFSNTSKLGLFETSDHASTFVLDAVFNVYVAQPNGASSKQRVNGSEVYSADAGSAAFDNPQVGADGADSSLMVGDIGEVLLYTAVLTTPQLTAVEAYLKAKWATP